VKKVNAQKFFRMKVSSSWGYLVKERKTLTKSEETIKEARKVYRDGIEKAWDIYTQDNIIVNEAKKTLNSAIEEAYKSCLPEEREGMSQKEYEQAKKLYAKTLSNVHCRFADTIAQFWAVFMKDMETSASLTKENI
jgi:hypothetical protein